MMLLFVASTFSQAPSIIWQRCLGGSLPDGDNGYGSIAVTSGGGYILAGSTVSNDGNVSGWHTGYSGTDENNNPVGPLSDVWVVKMDINSNIEWQKCYGGSGIDMAFDVQQTTDGGYIVAGSSTSLAGDGDISNHHGNESRSDMWVIKLDDEGTIEWEKSYGSDNGNEYGYALQQTDDGYVIAGRTNSNHQDVTDYHGGGDIWVVKLDNVGTLLWQKCLGGSDAEGTSSIQQTSNGGYIVAGSSTSMDVDVQGHHGTWGTLGTSDVWVVKLDETGTIEWQKSLGGDANDYGSSAYCTPDGGYIVSGTTSSVNYDAIGLHGTLPDAWIVKLSATGTIEWQKCLGGTIEESAGDAHSTADGGYIVAGTTNSGNEDVSGTHGEQFEWGGYAPDGWVVKLDTLGNIEWQKCLGGSDYERLMRIEQDTEGNYIMVGITKSNDYDVQGWHEGYDNNNFPHSDYWVVKLGAEGTVNTADSFSSFNSILVFPNPASERVTFANLSIGARISIADITGKEVYSTNARSIQEIINTSSLSEGVYMVRVNYRNSVESMKLVINH